MEMTKISPNAFVYPMPMVLVGAMAAGKANFMAVGWITRVNFQPPMIAVGLGNHHLTNAGILESQAFSVNVPGRELIRETDYCGLRSGRQADKSGVFDVFFGPAGKAPMIAGCAVCMECRLLNAVKLPTNTLFIGEITQAYARPDCLTDAGQPDIEKIKPFTLTMPDNNYWAVGEKLGRAWNMGNEYEQENKHTAPADGAGSAINA